MSNTLIIGCAGHGRVILDILRAAGEAHPIGWIDDAPDAAGQMIESLPVLGSTAELAALSQTQGPLRGIVGIGDNDVRRRCWERVRGLVPDFEFVSAVHPSAVIASGCVIGEGSVVMAGAILNPGCRIGRGCIVNTRASLDHDTSLGDFASVAPGVVAGGEVTIGEGSAVGIGAIIANRIRIGANTVVGAGAVVVRDLPDNVVAYGNPARVIRPRAADEPYLTAHVKEAPAAPGIGDLAR